MPLSPSPPAGLRASVSLQDEMALGRHLALTIGARVEDGDLTPVELQPNLRVSWQPHASSSVWAAASRATRTPVRYQVDTVQTHAAFEMPDGTPAVVRVYPSRALVPERLRALEAGYRVRLGRLVTVDAAMYHNRYADLITEAQMAPVLVDAGASSYLELPLGLANGARAETHGIETLVRWQVRRAWMLDASHTWLLSSFTPARPFPFSDAEHQWNAGSRATLAGGWDADARVYFVGELPGVETSTSIGRHTRIDAGVARSFGRGLRISLAGQNLNSSSHIESASYGIPGHPIPRSVHVAVKWEVG